MCWFTLLFCVDKFYSFNIRVLAEINKIKFSYQYTLTKIKPTNINLNNFCAMVFHNWIHIGSAYYAI